MLASFPEPAIIAHRGSSAYAPENTLIAFDLAYAQGADAVELDVKLCADGHVIVIHDQRVDRTTDGHGDVRSLTLKEIKKLDAGSSFDISYRGEKIPTLDETLEFLKGRIFINIELKNYPTIFDKLPDKVAELIISKGMEEQVLLSSFNIFSLFQVSKHLPTTPIALLTLRGKKGALVRSVLGKTLDYQALHVHYTDINPSMVERMIKCKTRIHAYTVNQVDPLHRLLKLGIHGFITDDPIMACKVIKDIK